MSGTEINVVRKGKREAKKPQPTSVLRIADISVIQSELIRTEPKEKDRDRKKADRSDSIETSSTTHIMAIKFNHR